MAVKLVLGGGSHREEPPGYPPENSTRPQTQVAGPHPPNWGDENRCFIKEDPIAAILSWDELGMLQEAPLSDRISPEPSFSERVALLLARSDCSLATSAEQREAIIRLRYEAGMRERAISGRGPLTFLDRYDETGNGYLFGLYVDDELASSIRVHIASKEHNQFPSLEVFADILQPKLDADKIIIDSTRFVADEYLAQLNRELPYVTFRVCMLAAQHFNADYVIVAASAQHQEFYRRAFNYLPVSQPRPVAYLAAPVRLMMLNYSTAVDELYRRYPFLRSTEAERCKLFGP